MAQKSNATKYLQNPNTGSSLSQSLKIKMRLNISTPIQNPPNATSSPRSSHQDHCHHSQHPRTPPSPLLIRNLLYLRCLFIGDQISLTVFCEPATVKHHRQSPIIHDSSAYRTTTSPTNTSSEVCFCHRSIFFPRR